jgi:hypothetical protein
MIVEYPEERAPYLVDASGRQRSWAELSLYTDRLDRAQGDRIRSQVSVTKVRPNTEDTHA